MSPKIALILLTYNAEKYIEPIFAAIKIQTLQPDKILVIDSSSKDQTIAKLPVYPNLEIKLIPQAEFDHGYTRQLATQLVDADIYIYMTQDAIPANTDTFSNIVAAFQNTRVGCAYGRQLPHKDAGLSGAHARLFNYPDKSDLRTLADVPRLGIKTCFNSDSFAAYRKEALMAVGGFPSKLIVGEDAYVAGQMLLNGWSVAYQADACVHHSHDYTIKQEFKRYFDIGAFHAMTPWLLSTFRSPEGEGLKFVKSELAYYIKAKAYCSIPSMLVRTAAKLLGYKLGRNYQKLSPDCRRRLSMHSKFWSS